MVDVVIQLLLNYVDGRFISLPTMLAPSFTGTCSRCHGYGTRVSGRLILTNMIRLTLPQRVLLLMDHPLILIWHLISMTATAGNFAELQLPLYQDEMIVGAPRACRAINVDLNVLPWLSVGACSEARPEDGS